MTGRDAGSGSVMDRVHLISDGAELARRRKLVPAGSVVEAWPDLDVPGHFWLGEASKALLDAVGEPLAPKLSVDGSRVPVYYGPKLCDIVSLPFEESLRARVLSARGVAVAWITVDQLGERTAYEPRSPADPVFFLRRPGSPGAHVWRLFRTRPEAIAYVREHCGKDPEALDWAESLPAENYEDLLGRGGPRA